MGMNENDKRGVIYNNSDNSEYFMYHSFSFGNICNFLINQIITDVFLVVQNENWFIR